MYNIRRTHKNLSFCCSFSFIPLCFIESLSVDGSFLPHMPGKGLSCRRCVGSKAQVKQFFSKCTGANQKFSLWLWKEILPFDSHKPDPQISRSVGWTRIQSQSCRFVSAIAAALNNTMTSYHIE